MASLIDRVAIFGAGAMGSGIAQLAAQAGCKVTLVDTNADALAKAHTRILSAIQTLCDRGKLSPDTISLAKANLVCATDPKAIETADLVIEAIIEDLNVKQSLYHKIEEQISPSAIIASNTSSLPISRLARGLKHPERFLGMHFFNPAPVMKLIEIIPGAATSPDFVAAIQAVSKSWGKTGILVADVPGFIVNRVARPFYAEAFRALTERVAPASSIDEAFRSAGFRMGPLELTDMIGQDVNFAVARSVYDSYFGQTRFTPQLSQAALVDAGWLGRKTGRGVYRYDEDASSPEPAPAISDPVTESVRNGARGLREQMDKKAPIALVNTDGALIGFSRGKTAAQESREHGAPVGLIDWFDPSTHGSIVYSASDEATAKIVECVASALDRRAIRITDRPGLLTFRALAQLVNGAADAVLEGVSDEASIDDAMRLGANYPFGPFAWADRIGRRRVVEILSNVAEQTGAPMYAPAQYLRTSA